MIPRLFPSCWFTAMVALFLALFLSPVRADLDFTVEGRPYRLVTTARTFAAAQTDAVSKGGSLVRIDSQAENDAIFAAISAAVPTTSTAGDGGGAVYVWIGGTETAEGNYAWLDAPTAPFWTGGKLGTVTVGSFANWGRGTLPGAGPEPDNFGGTQNRAAMGITAWPVSNPTKLGQPGQWNDIAESNLLSYVIEFSGIYAQFVMSHGGVAKPPFTTKLYFDKAPLTVANFVSLAEGTRNFIQEKQGVIGRQPYFNGLTSHRIIAGFMMQMGCPRGNGTGGPGYTIPDEFDPSILHTKAGILSMANSGYHTGGSQFFITAGPTTHLDYKHSVFGEVISGLNDVVLPLINSTPVNGSTPVNPVRIESITIHRSGASAQAFDANTPQLCQVSRLVPATVSANAAGHCLLHYPRQAHGTYELLQTGDFTSWSLDAQEMSMERTGPIPDATFDTFPRVPSGALRRFFRVAEVQYPTVLSPPSMALTRFTTAGDPVVNIIHDIGSGNTGTYTATVVGGPVLPGIIHDYVWYPNQHGGHLIFAVSGISIGGQNVVRFDYGLRYTNPTGGTFRGVMQTSNGFGLNDALVMLGTFTTGPLPPSGP